MEEEVMRGKIGRIGRPSPLALSSLAASSSEVESESTSTTYTVNGSHELVIKGYSLLKGLGIGQYVFSDKFQVGGHSWAIYFYPDGKNQEDNAVYVSLFVALAGEATDVRALFELTMVDQTGGGNHKIHSHFGRNPASGPYTLKYQGSMWGFKRFYRRTALDTSDYLKDDCLTIRCRVGVVKSRTDAPRQESIPVPSSCIAEHFGKLLESGEAADVKFQVDGEIFSAHKLVLAARSPVFRAQLFGPMKDKDTDLIVIEDMEAPVFKAFLHFIYWDTLLDMEEVTGFSAKCASTLMAQHLLDAADRYALERLKIICEDILCKNIAINTVSTTLALAEQHNCLHLKSMCLKFIAQSGNLRAVMQTDGFEHLKMSCPHLSFELLKYVAQVGENSANNYTCSSADALNLVPDGSDVGGRRVKQRR